jgi:hypothetical protein
LDAESKACMLEAQAKEARQAAAEAVAGQHALQEKAK